MHSSAWIHSNKLQTRVEFHYNNNNKNNNKNHHHTIEFSPNTTYLWIQTIAKLTDARSNLIKMDRLFAATALDNVHGHGNVEQPQQQIGCSNAICAHGEENWRQGEGCRILRVEKPGKRTLCEKNMARAQVRSSACSFRVIGGIQTIFQKMAQ